MPGLNLSRPGARRRRSPDAPNRRMVFTEAQKKAAGEGRVSRNWRTVFLLALAETSCVKHAAKAAGVAPARAYQTRREEADFRADWLIALEEGYANLEQEMLAHLRGTQTDHRIDTGSALRLLAHHSATVAQQRAVPQQDADPEERAARTLEDFIRRVRPAAFAALPRPGGEDGPAA